MRERERRRGDKERLQRRSDDSGWQQVVNRRRKTNVGLGSDDVSRLATTFFVSGFPGHWCSRDLWLATEKCGLLVDAFVPRRKDSFGAPYGFIRFVKVYNMKGLLEKLNNLIFEGFRMKVNVAKFPRGRAKGVEAEVRNDAAFRDRRFQDEGRRADNLTGVRDKMENKGVSYKDVLKRDCRSFESEKSVLGIHIHI
ncbi:hypothetical protein LXL04_008329 [Taraxacum kok-saghyz]